MTAAPLRARLARAASAHAMREAHASARLLREHYPAEDYANCLRAALREVGARVRRCPLPDLCRQAAAWAECARANGARFDVEAKACDAVRFSAEHNLSTLAVPSKLVGVASYQDAAAAVAARIDARGGWVLCDGPPSGDGADVFGLGLRLGRVQPKHARTWLAALGPVRVAVIAVTGGGVFVDRGGEVRRKTRGVNVAFEVGRAALTWSAAQEHATPERSAAEMQEMLRDLL